MVCRKILGSRRVVLASFLISACSPSAQDELAIAGVSEAPQTALADGSTTVSALPPVVSVSGGSGTQVSVDPLVDEQLRSWPSTTVILTFKEKPDAEVLSQLQELGIAGGYTFATLPMVIANIDATQRDALARRDDLLSIFANRVLQPHLDQSHIITGVRAARQDLQVRTEMFTRGTGNGQPVSGKGIGVAVVDTGLDATHPDLKLGQNVAQNVWFPAAENLLVTGSVDCALGLTNAVLGTELGIPEPIDSATIPLRDPDLGFVNFPVENVASSDIEGGHGTFVSGIIAGSGAASGGKYQGVAPGARLVVTTAGNDCGLPLHGIIGAFDYVLEHQAEHNIRVVNNSWGSRLHPAGLDPVNPINFATCQMHRAGITVVFSAGNAGEAANAINPYSTMPWVVSVAASEKVGFGRPASFTSRGVDDGTGADVAGDYDCVTPSLAPAPNLRPDITAPGVDIKSTRSKFPGITNVAGTVPIFVGANDTSTIDPGHLPYYTTSQGTSFSAPHISGIAALVLQANPNVTPDDVVTILRGTATPMPYAEREMGAGYVDAHNAVRRALDLAAVAHPVNLFPPPPPTEGDVEACTLPGIRMITDAARDHDGILGAYDLLAVSIAEAPSADFGRQLTFTIEVDDLGLVPPQGRWFVTFTGPDGEAHFAGMTTFNDENGGQPVFRYGNGDQASPFDEVGRGAPGSGYSPDGLIRVVVPASAFGIEPIASVTNIGAHVYQSAGSGIAGFLFGPQTDTGATFETYWTQPEGFCGDRPPPPPPPESECEIPGLTKLTDAEGDTLTGAAGHDLRSFQISQPFPADGATIKLVFRINTDPGARPDLFTSWFVSFDAPDGQVRGVRMTSNAAGQPLFQTYIVAAGSAGTKDGRFVASTAAADAASSFDPAKGEIAIWATPASVGVTAVGQALTGFNSGVTVTTSPFGGPGATFLDDGMPDTLARSGSYTVHDNTPCAP